MYIWLCWNFVWLLITLTCVVVNYVDYFFYIDLYPMETVNIKLSKDWDVSAVLTICDVNKYWDVPAVLTIFDLIAVAVDSVVSRLWSSILLESCIQNWCKNILNVWFLLSGPCAVDGMLKSRNWLTPPCFSGELLGPERDFKLSDLENKSWCFVTFHQNSQGEWSLRYSTCSSVFFIVRI